MPSQWPAGKNSPCESSSTAKTLATLPGPTSAIIRFDSAGIEAADVEKHATVAQVTGRPAVPARTYADLMAVGPRITDRCDHVVGVVRLHDYIGKTVRQQAIPHRRPTGRLVSFRAAEVVLFDGKQNHCVSLISHCGRHRASDKHRCVG